MKQQENVTKVVAVYSITCEVPCRDGVEIMRQEFKYGEALLVKPQDGSSELLHIQTKWKFEQVQHFLSAINYDTMRAFGRTLIMIGFITNPGHLRILINNEELKDVKYQEFKGFEFPEINQ